MKKNINNFNRIILTIAAAIVAATTITACGSDYNLNDYRREQLNNSMGELQRAAGNYSGLAISKLDGSTLGAFEVNVQPKMTPTPASGQTTASATPNLVVTVSFTGPGFSGATIVFQDGRYAGNSGGQFEAQCPAPGTTGPCVQMNSQQSSGQSTVTGPSTANPLVIDGTISSGRFVGHLYSQTAPQYGITFNLARNGLSARELLKNQRLQASKFATQHYYEGETYFSYSSRQTIRKPVVLTLTEPPLTPSLDQFYYLLVPDVPLVATLNYGNGAILAFDANFDKRLGELSGSTPWNKIFPSSSITSLVTLNCTELDSQKAFDCQLATGNNGVMASAVVTSEHTVSEPPDNPDTRANQTRTYYGSIQLSRAGFSFNDKTPVTLTVIYEARDRVDEISNLLFPDSEKQVQVSWQEVADPDINFSFSNAIWDGLDGTLNKTQSLQIPNSTATGLTSISCSNFFFYEKTTPFTCQFFNTFGNVSGTMTFNGHATNGD